MQTASAPKCTIIMATYNGMPYLVEQIESIQAQTEQGWLLLASDDASTDGTLEYLREVGARDPRIAVVQNPGPHGAYNNFYHAISLCRERFGQAFPGVARTPYYFFADQDDVWEPEKIQVMLEELARLEADEPAGTPVFCYANLELIDGEGNSLGHLTSDLGVGELAANPLCIFFSHRYVHAMSMALNRALFDLAEWPRECVNDICHDNYFVRYAVLYGAFSFTEQPLARYRRHGNNVSGLPKKYGLVGGIRHMLTSASTFIDGNARFYWISLVMLAHLPRETEVSRKLRACFEKGGPTAVRFCSRHRVHPGNAFTTGQMYFNLFTRAYRRTSWFTDEAHVRAMTPAPAAGVRKTAGGGRRRLAPAFVPAPCFEGRLAA